MVANICAHVRLCLALVSMVSFLEEKLFPLYQVYRRGAAAQRRGLRPLRFGQGQGHAARAPCPMPEIARAGILTGFRFDDGWRNSC